MYTEEITVDLDITNIVGINKHIKKRFDKMIKDTRIEFCKQTK